MNELTLKSERQRKTTQILLLIYKNIVVIVTNSWTYRDLIPSFQKETSALSFTINGFIYYC